MPRLTRFCRRVGIPLCPKWADEADRELGEWCQRLCNGMEQQQGNDVIPVSSSSEKPVVWNALVDGLRNEDTKRGRASVLYPTALSNLRLSVASELFDHVLTGQETAGTALAYLAWRLSQPLELQHQLRAELLGLAPSMRWSGDGDTLPPPMPDAKQLDGLPLLHAILMETLRLHAPIPGPQPRQTPETGCQIGQYHIPGGVRIAALAFTLHRDESIFPNPEKWDHTRWLDTGADKKDRKRRNRQFWAFSSGGRMCIGSNFAMHGELKFIRSSSAGF